MLSRPDVLATAKLTPQEHIPGRSSHAGLSQETTIAKHMSELRRLIRNGCRHIQVHGTTGCGKSRLLSWVVAEQVHRQGQTLVLTTSTVDVTGMQKDAWKSSCYRMGDGRYGGDDERGSHC